MKQILVEPIILLFAFRYALGRMTYAPGLVKAGILSNLDAFSTDHLKQMANEIDEANQLGMECDRNMWLRMRFDLLDEIKRRQNNEY